MAFEENIAGMIEREDMTPIISSDNLVVTSDENVQTDESGDILAEDVVQSAELPGTVSSTVSLQSSSLTGVATYPQVIPNSPIFQVPSNPLLPEEYSEILDYNAVQYQNGIYRTQIGRFVRVEQLMSSDSVQEYEGYLIGVGINYIILQDYAGGNIRILDIYGIKNMYVYYANIQSPSASSEE